MPSRAPVARRRRVAASAIAATVHRSIIRPLRQGSPWASCRCPLRARWLHPGAEIATEPLGHLLLRRGDEAATDRAAAGATRDELVGQRIQRTLVAAPRTAAEHSLDNALAPRIHCAATTTRTQH